MLRRMAGAQELRPEGNSLAVAGKPLRLPRRPAALPAADGWQDSADREGRSR